MSLFAELKRRNVFRVAAAYLVVGWLLIEVSDTVFPRLGLPEWTVTLVIALVLLGLPLALFMAWAFELTPDGMKRTEDVAEEPPVVRTGWRRTDRLIVVALVAVIALLVGERFWMGERTDAESPASGEVAATPPAGAPARSIAVLAFDDLSPQRDQAYFAEGISEELLNLLARIEGFKVAARTSSFKFRGANLDIGEIGRALNVETVLEGSVRKSGNQLRVTAQLINVADGFHLWSQSYDRELSNIFAVQDEIATAIVDALKLKLDLGAATAGRTQDTAAYDHYLRGRQLGRQPTQAGLLRAVQEFEQAIAIDPGFAAAYAGIADAWVWLEDYGGIRSAEAFPQGRAGRAPRARAGPAVGRGARRHGLRAGSLPPRQARRPRLLRAHAPAQSQLCERLQPVRRHAARPRRLPAHDRGPPQGGRARPVVLFHENPPQLQAVGRRPASRKQNASSRACSRNSRAMILRTRKWATSSATGGAWPRRCGTSASCTSPAPAIPMRRRRSP
jgi:TolB-like protein/preprotein translocase subunit Sec61beta